jgi:FtsZ-interacting cell division protein ZipA
MSELRWTLLILGVVFLAALSWWERRRPRQAFAPRLRDAGPAHAELRNPIADGTARPGEPWIGDAEISDTVLSDVALDEAADTAESAGDDAFRVHTDPSIPGPLEELPTLIIPAEEDPMALEAAWDEELPEPGLIVDPEATATPAPAAVATSQPVAFEPEPDSQERPQAPRARAPVVGGRAHAAAPAAPAALDAEIPGAEGVGTVRIVPPAVPDGAWHAEPIVDWPPEESRRIVALRLVAALPDRFAGRALRLALAAEGFLLGKFSIFHKPDESNRAVLSAASLTRPGAFDLETMDSQRYAGISLFAVLPGPRSPLQAFEELLATARNLNERLEGALQDERGGPLTPLRIASLRESLKGEAADPPAAAANET